MLVELLPLSGIIKNLQMKIPSYVLLFAALNLFVQDASAQSAPAIKLNHLAVYVYNLEKSTQFYDTILRFKKIPEPFHDNRHTWYSLGTAGQLHLIQGADKDIKRDKNDHLCFSVNSIDEFIAILNKHNIEYSNWPGKTREVTVRVDGVKQIYFQDPDGHWIEINNDTTVMK
jgi:lactoylglutathione lyase